MKHAALIFVSLSLAACITSDDCTKLSGDPFGMLILSGAKAIGLQAGGYEPGLGCTDSPASAPQAITPGEDPCAPREGDDPCAACARASCCAPVVACADDAACSCLAVCRTLGTCTEDEERACGPSALYAAADACLDEHCPEECTAR